MVLFRQDFLDFQDYVWLLCQLPPAHYREPARLPRAREADWLKFGGWG